MPAPPLADMMEGRGSYLSPLLVWGIDMDPEDVNRLVSALPFEAFRMVLTTGESFDVRHPELIMLGRRSLMLGLASDPGQTYYDRTAKVSLLHIVRLEPIEPSSKSNGDE